MHGQYYKPNAVYQQSRKIVKPEPKEVFALINKYIQYYEDEIQKTTRSDGIKSLLYSFSDWVRLREEKLQHHRCILQITNFFKIYSEEQL